MVSNVVGKLYRWMDGTSYMAMLGFFIFLFLIFIKLVKQHEMLARKLIHPAFMGYVCDYHMTFSMLSCRESMLDSNSRMHGRTDSWWQMNRVYSIFWAQISDWEDSWAYPVEILVFACPTGYNQVSISVTPISVIISYMLRKFYSPTKTQFVRLVSVMC